MAVEAAATVDETFVRSFTERWLGAWNARDPDRIVSLCTEDIVYEDPAIPNESHSVKGRDETRRFLEEFFVTFPDLELKIPEQPLLALDNSRVAVRWDMTGTMLGPTGPPGLGPTGEFMRGQGVDLYDFRDGLLSRYQAFYDLAEWLMQMGLMPPPGSPVQRFGLTMQRRSAKRRYKKALKQRGA